jgi:hypothetical protein
LLAWLISRTRWQAAIPILAITLAIGAIWQSDAAIDLIDAWGGDLKGWLGQPRARQGKIKIGDEEFSDSATSKRIHVVDLYRTAMGRAGLFGFGTEAVTGFPVNVPVGQQDLATLKSIWTVDNAFLLMGLRFGYAGMLCLVAVCISTAFLWLRMTIWGSLTPGLRAFTAGTAGVSITMLLVLLTVWMPQDFGFWFVLTWGAAVGMNEGLPKDAGTHQASHRHRHSSTAKSAA